MLAEPVQYLRLDLEIKVPYHIVLDGLDAWFEWELISEMDFRWRNKKLSANRLTVVARQNEAILQGLDLWLELGLITEESVKLICQTRLVCELKSRVTEPVLSGQSFRESQTNRALPNTANLPRSTVATAPVKTPQPPNKVVQTLRSLFSEFSTMWLLFLGVFLVVVSSGLLAASQWDNFSAEMQYLLLLAYTLGFFGVSFWTSQNEQLRMTTRALQLVTLLLGPANFWAMDGLGLLKNPVGLGLSAIAGGLLSWIAVFLLQTSFRFQESQAVSEDAATNQARRRTKKQLSQISILAILVLDWLHLGWFVSPYYPLIAVYLGIGAIATSTFVNRRQGLNTVDSSTFPLALITGAYSTVLLVSRALLFGNVSIFKLGLAFGICGWVLVQIANKAAQLSQQSANKANQTVDQKADQKAINPTAEHPSVLGFQASLGKILLGLGWFVSVWDRYPWQTLAISLLIAWMICDRIFKKEEPIDLGYAFLWGLQILWLVQRLIPADWMASLTRQLLTLLQTPSEVSLLGTVLFPYLIVTLVIAAIYRDRQKQELANTAELLALGFGVLLTVISIGYASTIFINLALSAVTLLIIQAKRKDTSKDLHSLVYFTHIVSLSAIISGVYFFTRSTSTFTWVGFLLGATLIEWSAVLAIGKFNATPQPETHHLQAWRDSAWHIGASLAALSYILLWNVSLIGRSTLASSELIIASYWGVAWLCVPISLTFLGTWREFADRDLAIKLSIAGLLLAQFLTWGGDGSRIIGLGIAFALMLVNTRRSESLLTAFNTVGYGLLFIASLLWQFKSNDGTVAQFTFWTNGMVFSAILLYVLNHWLKFRRERHVANLNLTLNKSYSQAFDIWAALISAALLILQTYLAVSVFQINLWNSWGLIQESELFVSLLPSTLLVTLGLVYRMGQAADKIPAWTLWSIAWSVEILAAGAVSFAKGGIIELAIANIGLGFFTQLLGDWWIQRQNIQEYPRSWDFIPLIYGAIGSLLRLSIFSSITGLFSLSTALICIGIGRRSADSNPNAKSLIYLSMGLITFSAYELLFYQMLRNSQGGSLGDASVILAALGCAIAYVYRLFANGLKPYLRISHRAISTFAHLHWSISIVFLLLGILLAPSSNGGIIGTGIATALSVYAIAQARKSHLNAEFWTYTGIANAIGAIGYLLYFAFPNTWLIANILQPYAAAIACMVTVILYVLPWQEWGWQEQPWHNSAFALPLIFTCITATAIATPCLIFVGAFYAIYAKLKSQIRATYITVFLWDWVFFKTLSFANYGWSGFSLLSNATVIGLSGLYFAQVEPNLRSQDNREVRHFLRSLCSGGMGLVAFFYSLDNPNIAITSWIFSIVFILAGLALRVRAYLFMGTLTFVLLVITQAVILVTQYSFLMWALGIIAGIGFILVAANFEVRRDRILALFRNFAIELETWD